MADQDHDRMVPASGPSPAEETTRGRKPYVKPAFEFDRVFETTALACGKVNATQAQCRVNRKNS